MRVEPAKVRYPVETGLLVAIAAFLPLLEAPKNLAWLGYAVAWIWNRARARDFGGRWDLWDTLIAAWIASGYLVAAFAATGQDEWKGANDLLCYASILWMVKRGGYSAAELRWVLAALIASALASLAWGWWKYRLQAAAGQAGALQLKSVGHVNHSAIYLAIVVGLCSAWLFARWGAWRAGMRAAALAVGAILIASLVAMASRGALAAAFLLILVLAAAWWPRSRAPLVASLAALAVASVIAVGTGAEVISKHMANVARDDVLSARDRIWRIGLAAWERHPWFGVGMSNFRTISTERVEGWRRQAGKDFDARLYLGSDHAHSLYVTTLAERGLMGASALAAVLLAWLAWLLRYRPARDASDDDWLLWGGAASAWMVSIAVGVVNTTLHHEHGILAMLLLGAWLSNRPRRAS